jgi:predicted amidohydrolase
MERIRVAALQYFIRPISTFDQFADQVSSLVETAADYNCQLVVFPEYFTTQLLTLGNVKRPMPDQIRELAVQAPRFVGLVADLARRHRLYIVAGSIPVTDDSGAAHNRSFCFNRSGDCDFQPWNSISSHFSLLVEAGITATKGRSSMRAK